MKVKLKQLCISATALYLCLCLFPAKALAYLDPGAGSSILQLLLASLLGVLYAIKLYWVRIKTFVAKWRQGKRRPESR
jgi:hypothetical protein